MWWKAHILMLWLMWPAALLRSTAHAHTIVAAAIAHIHERQNFATLRCSRYTEAEGVHVIEARWWHTRSLTIVD